MTSTNPHAVARDPGTVWFKEAYAAIDAPPDDAAEPLPEDQWPVDMPRTGIYGVVTPNVVALPEAGYRMYYTQILPRLGFPAGANDYNNSTTRILSAFSDDGMAWTPEAGVRLSSEQGGAGAFRVVSPEVVPLTDGSGRWRMYFECCPGPQSVASRLRSASGSAFVSTLCGVRVRVGNASAKVRDMVSGRVRGRVSATASSS